MTNCKICKEELSPGDLMIQPNRITAFAGIFNGNTFDSPALKAFNINVTCHTACLVDLLSPLEIVYDITKPRVVNAEEFSQISVLQANNETGERGK